MTALPVEPGAEQAPTVIIPASDLLLRRVDAAPVHGKNSAITDADVVGFLALSEAAREDVCVALAALGCSLTVLRKRLREAQKAIDVAAKQASIAALPKPVPRATDFELGDHPELGRAMLDKLATDERPAFDLGKLHTYSADTGVWSTVEESAQSRAVQNFSGAWLETDDGKPKRLRLRKTDVRGAMDLAHDQAAHAGFFDGAAPGLAFVNGFLRFMVGVPVLEPHAPEHAARFCYAFDYDPAATCPKWLAFLVDAFRGDADAADKIALIQEFGGASLFGVATKYQKAIVLHGEGSNGKNVLGSVISAGMPAGSVCSVEPQRWGEEYYRSHMVGCLLNYVSELPEDDIINTKDVKSTIDGSPKTARNPCEKVVNYMPRMGQLLSANRLPATTDHSHGFWRRFFVILFHRVFEDHEKNPNLDKEIIGEELPGVVAWLVAGMQRLLRQGRYTEPQSSVYAVARWRHDADPVASFAEERTRKALNDAERTPAAILFRAYAAWSDANRYRTLSAHRFGIRMNGLKLGSEHTSTGQVYPVVLLRPREDTDEAHSLMMAKMGVDVAPPAPPPVPAPVVDEAERVEREAIEEEARLAAEAEAERLRCG